MSSPVPTPRKDATQSGSNGPPPPRSGNATTTTTTTTTTPAQGGGAPKGAGGQHAPSQQRSSQDGQQQQHTPRGPGGGPNTMGGRGPGNFNPNFMMGRGMGGRGQGGVPGQQGPPMFVPYGPQSIPMGSYPGGPGGAGRGMPQGMHPNYMQAQMAMAAQAQMLQQQGMRVGPPPGGGGGVPGGGGGTPGGPSIGGGSNASPSPSVATPARERKPIKIFNPNTKAEVKIEKSEEVIKAEAEAKKRKEEADKKAAEEKEKLLEAARKQQQQQQQEQQQQQNKSAAQVVAAAASQQQAPAVPQSPQQAMPPSAPSSAQPPARPSFANLAAKKPTPPPVTAAPQKAPESSTDAASSPQKPPAQNQPAKVSAADVVKLAAETARKTTISDVPQSTAAQKLVQPPSAPPPSSKAVATEPPKPTSSPVPVQASPPPPIPKDEPKKALASTGEAVAAVVEARASAAQSTLPEPTLAEKPKDGKYTEEFLRSLMDSPYSTTKFLKGFEVPSDVEFWPVPGFIAPPGVQSQQRNQSRGSRGGSRGGGGGGGQPNWDKGARGGGDGQWEHRSLPDDHNNRRGGNRRDGGYGNNNQYRGPPPGVVLPELHKTENVYVIGKVQDEEEKKQREFKSLLNKLTPENFGKLLEKVIDVGITEPKTLIGLIGQMFDKALTEPIFSAIYADMCAKLSERFIKDNVQFIDTAAPEGQNQITFKRVLLNKCQEAFESGDAQIKANYKLVEKHKKACKTPLTKEDAERIAKEEASKDGSADVKPEDLEEGEIAPTPKVKTLEELELDRRREMNRLEEDLLKSRRRMLGNIRFIGELFKKSMLTERIMHTCIQKLLKEGDAGKEAATAAGEDEDDGPSEPDEEDVEALSKLLTTVGSMIDHPKAEAYLNAYFRRIETLTKASHLSSRHRFMLQDVIELRQKGWKVRRQAEGPKKIDEIHRDAQRQAMEQARGGDRRGGSSGRDRGGPGGPGLRRSDSRSSTSRLDGGGDRRGSGRDGDSRSSSSRNNSSKPMERPRIVQKPRGSSILGGGSGGGSGGVGGGDGGDGEFKVVESRSNPPSRSNTPKLSSGKGSDLKEDSSRPETPRSDMESEFDDETGNEEERKRTLEYFLDDKDVGEAIKSISTWNNAKVGIFIQQLCTVGFDRRGMEWEASEDLTRELSRSGYADAVLDGISEIFNDLEDVICDLPKADSILAGLLAHPLADGTIKLADVAKALEAAKPDGGDDGQVVKEGLALPLLCKLLVRVSKIELEDSVKADAHALVEEANLDLLKFVAHYEDDKEGSLAEEIGRYEGLKEILDGE